MQARSVALLALVGCYHAASESPCNLLCPCPSTLDCGPDNRCHEPGAPACNGAVADGGIDARSDASDATQLVDGTRATDATDATLCYGHLLSVNVCGTDAVTHTYPQDAAVIDTDNGCGALYLQPNSEPPVCVISAFAIQINGYTRVAGSRPLLLVAASTIQITPSGTLDAGSARTWSTPGPGANYSCAATPNGADSPSLDDGGGGGAGGSFGGLGGAGGGGIISNYGSPTGEPAPTFVRGGCAGGNGGMDFATNLGGVGGNGGGAVYLLAGSTIQIDGSLYATGEGGGPPLSTSQAGAGGGGSGGLVALDAPTVTVSGSIIATGGGGGGGGDPAGTNTANAGNDPANVTAASGGSGCGNAGGGGVGSSKTSSSGSQGSFGGASTSAAVRGTGGGGGGGGTGHILVYMKQPLASSNVAPTPE